MYALALLMSAGTAAATTGLPYFHLGSLDVGLPLQSFGIIVAAGVLIGATPLRRYAEWHGVSDDHIRGLLTWIMVSGFLGAHEFDVVAYQWDRIGDATVVQPAGWWFLPVGMWPSNWPLVLRIWDGISSYGGFIGGALGFALFVWWKRLPPRLFADIGVIGLLPAFTIGRIGCTVVSDHIGAAVDGDRWYAFLAMDYPRKLNLGHLADTYPGTSEVIKAWNLGLVEFLYLVPVNIVVLWLAFRPSKRTPAGFVSVLTAMLYAPVRFFLDYLRPEDTDPRYFGMTFAQWSSILVFGVAVYAASRILKNGKPAETVAPTSREAQERLRIILREDEEAQQKQGAQKQDAKKGEVDGKKADLAQARVVRDRDATAVPAKVAVVSESEASDDADDADGADGAEADETSDRTTPGSKASAVRASGSRPAVGKAAGQRASGNKSGGNKAGAKAAGKTGNKNRNKNR